MSDKEELIQCPYDTNHRILKLRMASHLIKCRRHHSFERYVTCPFNATHDVPEPELEYHVKTCENRKTVEQFVYVTDEPKPVDEIQSNIEMPNFSENWDEDRCSGGSYLNIKEDVLEKNLVFRAPIGKTKSERKDFFEQEGKKFRDGGVG